MSKRGSETIHDDVDVPAVKKLKVGTAAVAAEKRYEKESVIDAIERHPRADAGELQDYVDYMLNLPTHLLHDFDVWVVALQVDSFHMEILSDYNNLRVHPLIKKLYSHIPGHLFEEENVLGFVTAVIHASKGFCVFVDMEGQNFFKKYMCKVPACFIAWLQASGRIVYEAWLNDWIKGEHFHRGKKWVHDAVFKAVQDFEKNEKCLFKGGFIFDMMHPLCFDTKQKMANAVVISYRKWRMEDSAANGEGNLMCNMLKRDFPHYYHDHTFVSLLMQRYGMATCAECREFADNFPRHMYRHLTKG